MYGLFGHLFGPPLRAIAGEPPRTSGHDTISLLALDSQRRLAGACSSSGAANKLPGRVGDSPIIGSGLYIDKTVGAPPSS